jgi:ubiquinone/menaquinone biosynthesis C-methylase UbiE
MERQAIDPPAITTAYIIDIENGSETARLIHQDRLFTEAMGGLFPEQLDLSAVQRVLDLACGPGAWALEVAFAHRDIHVLGVDINRGMIDYARARASVQQLENLCFEVMDVKKPLQFADHSFDLVNARFLVGFMNTSSWLPLLRECLRILKAEGILLLTECEFGISNSPALQRLSGSLYQALYKQGRTFSVDRHSIGISHMLGKLLREAGFQKIGKRAFLLDASCGAELYDSSRKEAEITFALLKPYLVRSEVVEEEVFEKLYQEMLVEMMSGEFVCVSFGVIVWGVKVC